MDLHLAFYALSEAEQLAVHSVLKDLHDLH